MKPLNTARLRAFLQLAGNRLKGEWLLVGGAVLPLLGVNHRTTLDINLVNLHDADGRQTLAMMRVADELGLPVETINQAAILTGSA